MRLASFAIVLALSTLVLSSVALAEPTWCEEDPVFVVNGLAVDVTTGFDGAELQYVDGIDFVLEVPANVTASASLAASVYVPITATVTRTLDAWTGVGAIPVVAHVTVNGKRSFDTATRVTGTYGALVSTTLEKSNKTLSLAFELGQ
jgi:hypothetical protein